MSNRSDEKNVVAVDAAAEPEGQLNKYGNISVEDAEKLVVDWTPSEERWAKLKYCTVFDSC